MSSRTRAIDPMTPFVRECQRLLDARLKATNKSEKDDAAWAMEYLFTMQRAGRLDDYFAQLSAQQAAS